MRRLKRVLRIIFNSFVFVVLVIMATMFWPTNPLLSIVLAMAAFDQFEDVYYYTYRRRLLPDWFMPFDVIFEMIVIAIGVGMLVLGLIYYSYFETWFFRSLVLLSFPVIFTAVEDIILWRQPPPEQKQPAMTSMPGMGVTHYVRPIRKKRRWRFIEED